MLGGVSLASKTPPGCCFGALQGVVGSPLAAPYRAMVQLIAIDAEHHRFTFRQTRCTFAIRFSIMLVQVSEGARDAMLDSIQAKYATEKG